MTKNVYPLCIKNTLQINKTSSNIPMKTMAKNLNKSQKNQEGFINIKIGLMSVIVKYMFIKAKSRYFFTYNTYNDKIH